MQFDPSQFGADAEFAPDPSNGGHRGGAPEIMFEDLEGMEFGDGNFEELTEEGLMAKAPRGRRKDVKKKPPPFQDEELPIVDALSMARDELIWAVGRASSLKLAHESMWNGFSAAIAAVGEAELSPSEVCRLVQAFAYAPTEAPLDQRQLQRLLKAFATQVNEYNDERLMRMIYAYGKLAMKRGLKTQRFLDFTSSEVVERRKLGAWRKVRILRAVGNLPGAGAELRSVLAPQIVKEIGDLDTETWCAFVPIMVEQKLHKRPGVLSRVNTAYKQKIFCYKVPDLLLRSGAALVLRDLMKTSTLVLWLNRLHDLRLPIVPSMVDGVPWPGKDDGSSSAPPSTTVAGARRAAENLRELKVVELCLRHERPGVVEALSHKPRHLLTLARRTPLEPPEDFEMLELPFVFAGLSRLFRDVGILLHPTIEGPYLLELADPLGRVVVEWDENWSLYPPWRRKAQEEFVRRKHLHLKSEGWKVLCISLAEIQGLPDRGSKLDFVERFATEHGLDHLRVPA